MRKSFYSFSYFFLFAAETKGIMRTNTHSTEGPIMANSTRPSIPMFLLHLFLTVVTSGGWLVVLVIWYLLKKK